MPSSDESQKSTNNKRKITLADVRNAAIIVASLAVAYKAVYVPSAPTESYPQLPVPAVATVANTGSVSSIGQAAVVSPDPVKADGISIINGKLTLGNDEASVNYRKFLQTRIQEINQQGPMKFTAPVPQVKEPSYSQTSNTIGSGAQQLPTPPSAPIIRSDEKDPAASIKTENGTLHPAPFTDKTAKASIDAKNKYVMDNKLTATVKIGSHLDGTPMTVAESEQQVRDTLSRIQDEWTLIYKAPNEKVRLYVFTDSTCQFCQKLHKSMDQLLNAGISVHYFMYPRDMANMPEGALSSTAVNFQNVWCSVDQKEAMDSAFQGYKLPKADCGDLPESLHRWPSPVEAHYQMGESFNVTGTPAWFASNGKHDIGFSNAQTMIKTLLGE
jgi:protein-disulfide isomerase